MTPPDYTARILLIAGGTPQGKDAIRDVEIIDFSEDVPRYRECYPLKHPRYYVYPVILPDKSVLVVGGKSGKKGHLHNNTHKHKHHHQHNGDAQLEHHPDAILEPEILPHGANKWMPVADMKVDRLYHSNAILLPDGRVMTAGSNPQRLENELRIEIFQPPYLFKGKRPKITKTQGEIQNGKSFEIETSDNVKEICLIRPSVTTHCVNTEQRYVGLEFKRTDDHVIQASTPSNKNLAPPGYYMLFILDENDIPSVAHFVCISS